MRRTRHSSAAGYPLGESAVLWRIFDRLLPLIFVRHDNDLLPMLAHAEKQIDGKLIEPFVAQIALAERRSIEGVGLQRCCRR